MQPNMQKYQLTPEEIDALLDRAPSAVISMVGEDGWPYGMPINFVRLDGKIYFHGRKVGQKMSNLEKDPRCCLTVMDEGGFERCGDMACNTTTIYESAVLLGRVVPIEDEGLKMKVLRATVDKLTPARKDDVIDPAMVPGAGVYEIVVESATGKYHRPAEGHHLYPNHPE